MSFPWLQVPDRCARAIAFDPDGTLIYVAARNTHKLAIVDCSTHTIVAYVDPWYPS